MKDIIVLAIEKLMEVINPLINLIIDSGVPTAIGVLMIMMMTIGAIIMTCGFLDFIKESIRRAGAHIIIKYNL